MSKTDCEKKLRSIKCTEVRGWEICNIEWSVHMLEKNIGSIPNHQSLGLAQSCISHDVWRFHPNLS